MTEKLEQSTETSTLITANDSKPMTFGEKLVGLSFNPSVDQKVQRIKELAAKMADFRCTNVFNKIFNK